MALRFGQLKLGFDNSGVSTASPCAEAFGDMTAGPSLAPNGTTGAQGWTHEWIALLPFDAHAEFCHAMCMEARVMPLPSDQRAIVHVVDDDPSMRAALQDLFQSIGLETRTYAIARDFIPTDASEAPGCLVIDIRLPDVNGLDFLVQLTQAGVRLPVVMMTGYGDIPMSVRAMKRGAFDFLPKPFKDQDMLDAVLGAIERDRQRRVVDSEVSQVRERFATLSAREQQVMLLVTAGKMNKQVAGDLGISEVTAKIHRGAVMRKMAARTLADLVRMADLVHAK
jgi:FixJ family two-component response regulator